MSYLVSALVDDVLNHLAGTAHDVINLLKTSMSASTENALDTVVFVNPMNGAVPGVYLSIDDETMLILTISSSGNTSQVLRGQKGSTAGSHSANALIYVDPAWPRWAVMSTIRDEIRSWGPQVYQVLTVPVDIATQANVMGYDLGEIQPFYRVLKVRQTPPAYIASIIGGDNGAVTSVADDRSWPEVPFHVDQAAPLSDFPSGNALFVETTSFTLPGVLHVTYAAPFDVDTAWADTTDLLADVGLKSYHLDIPAYGAAWRLLSFRQPRRLFTQMQGQPRDAQEVPALALMQAAQQFKAFRDDRLWDSERVLLETFPLEMEVGWL